MAIKIITTIQNKLDSNFKLTRSKFKVTIILILGAMNNIFHIETRALLRLERTMNLLCQGGEGGRGGEGGMTVRHILMAPQYLNNNHVTYYVIT